MSQQNTPAIASILAYHKLEKIPEAHCYLKYGNHILDVTFPEATEFTFKHHLEQEILISPEQIGDFKVNKHKEYIREWIKDQPDLNLSLVWAVREKCIEQLSIR